MTDMTTEDNLDDTIATEAAESLSIAMHDVDRLRAAGFTVDDFGQYLGEGARVNLYPCFGEWEINVTLPGGGGISLAVARFTVQGRRYTDCSCLHHGPWCHSCQDASTTFSRGGSLAECIEIGTHPHEWICDHCGGSDIADSWCRERSISSD